MKWVLNIPISIVRHKYCLPELYHTGCGRRVQTLADERDWVWAGRGKQYLCRTIVKVRGTIVHATAKTIQSHQPGTKGPKIRIFCSLNGGFVYFCSRLYKLPQKLYKNIGKFKKNHLLRIFFSLVGVCTFLGKVVPKGRELDQRLLDDRYWDESVREMLSGSAYSLFFSTKTGGGSFFFKKRDNEKKNNIFENRK